MKNFRRRISPLNEPDGIESAYRMTPIRIEDPSLNATDLVAEINDAAQELGRGVPTKTLLALAGVVRVVNSYYSNMIENNPATPHEIEAALKEDEESIDPAKRIFAQEAAAHVRLQEVIDTQASEGTLPDPTAPDYLKWLHLEFYRDCAEELLTMELNGEEIKLVPGEWRDRDVKVGEHIPPSPHRVDDCMKTFHTWYQVGRLGRTMKVAAIPGAHHRLLFIHPFADGNGRVTRLMSHAMCHKAGIAAGGLWSVSRGLARGLRDDPAIDGPAQYMHYVSAADKGPRRAGDGGNLSKEALEQMTEWFLAVCLDQIRYMSELFNLDSLEARLTEYVVSCGKKEEAAKLLHVLLMHGEIERGRVPAMLGVPERTASRMVTEFTREGLIGSDTPRGPISLRFPVKTHEALFPRLS